MTDVYARRALLPDGWAQGVRVIFDESGIISAIGTGREAHDDDIVTDVLLPAPGNLHSHAFQRAMAGLTEHRSSGQDDFWSWRTLMYRFLDVLTPEAVEAIAALVYVEMLEAGYASVGEFHYLHHQPGGGAYENVAEMSARIAAAAAKTGIGLTHLPVLYTYGGADKLELSGGQLRFGCDLERFQTLYAAARDALNGLPADFSIGIAPHSLRATAPEQFEHIMAIAGSGPIHIHIAEQQKEVRDVQSWLGARPVEWLMANAPVDPRWCLIHATHMNESETRDVARSGAVAGLCPITEANLGDGAFNGNSYLGHGGRFGVGSDSNVRISLTEELRQLEYSQRQRHEARNVMATANQSCGRLLFEKALEGGALSLGRNCGALEVGRLADMVALEGDDVALTGLMGDRLLDGWVFAADDTLVRDVWSAGRHCVRQGRHVGRLAVEQAYRATMADLMARL